jgi:hypothetical protein
MKLLYFLLALANAEWISPTPSQSYLRGTIEPELEPNKSYIVDILFIVASFMAIIVSNSLPPKKHEYRITNKMPVSILNI